MKERRWRLEPGSRMVPPVRERLRVTILALVALALSPLFVVAVGCYAEWKLAGMILRVIQTGGNPHGRGREPV